VQQIMYDFLDISGYVRAGYGRNDRGGVQVPFTAPGAPSKYRLGNETEVYGELAFGKNFYLADTFSRERESAATDPQALHGPVARVQFRPSYSLSYTGESSWALPEAWGAVGNVFEAQPGLKFWAGNRFYRRYDVHMIDWFFYNMSGLGGGVEDLDLGFGKAAIAWLGNSSGSAAYTDAILDDAANRSGFAKSSFDFRLYDVPLPLGKGEFGVVYAKTEGGEGTVNGMDRFTVPDADGFSFHFLHLAEKFLDERSVNKLSVQGGWGGAKNLTSGFEIFNLDGVNYITPELPDAWRVRFSEDFILQPSDMLSLGAVLAFQYTDYDQLGIPGLAGMASGVYGGKRYWYSAGARPTLHFTRNLSLAFEGGVDYTDTDGMVDTVSNLHGTLWKVTVAPQVSLGRHFMSRPTIRMYFTYAGWLNGFEGYVGGPTYADRDYGYAAGLQMEAWW
jgi:maltoporin